MNQEYGDERDMLPRHLRSFLAKSHKERFIIANQRYITRTIGSVKYHLLSAVEKNALKVHDQELLAFMAALQQNEVEYIVTGGFAMNMHGFSHYMDDIDLWIRDAAENRDRLHKTFFKFGLNENSAQLTYGLAIKIITSMPLSFEDCLKTAVIAMVDDIIIPVLGIDQMIECETKSTDLKYGSYQGVLEEIRRLTYQQ